MASKLGVGFKVDLSSVAAVQAALNGVKQGVINRVLKGAIGIAARKVAKIAKAKAPMGQTGALKRSIGVKYKSYQKGAVWVFVVGARRGMSDFKPAPYAGGMRFIKTDPAKIAHLAESGRKALVVKKAKFMAFFTLRGSQTSRRPRNVKGAVFIKKVAAAKGTYFMAAAYSALGRMKTQISLDVLNGILREAANYASKGKSIYY